MSKYRGSFLVATAGAMIVYLLIGVTWKYIFHFESDSWVNPAIIGAILFGVNELVGERHE